MKNNVPIPACFVALSSLTLLLSFASAWGADDAQVNNLTVDGKIGVGITPGQFELGLSANKVLGSPLGNLTVQAGESMNGIPGKLSLIGSDGSGGSVPGAFLTLDGTTWQISMDNNDGDSFALGSSDNHIWANHTDFLIGCENAIRLLSYADMEFTSGNTLRLMSYNPVAIRGYQSGVDSILFNGESGSASFAGSIQVNGQFIGSGAGLTSIPGSAISSGSIPFAKLNSSEMDGRYINATGDTMTSLTVSGAADQSFKTAGAPWLKSTGNGVLQDAAFFGQNLNWNFPAMELLTYDDGGWNQATFRLTRYGGIYNWETSSPNGPKPVMRLFGGSVPAVELYDDVNLVRTVRTRITAGGISYFTGNVGIGTAAPAEKLHVTGNIKTDGRFIGSAEGLHVPQMGDLSMGTFTQE
jgi:hypothetical protein